MKNHDGCERGFVWSSRAWYARHIRDEEPCISLGMYADGAGSSGEMTVRWVALENNKPPVPQLRAFDDSWSALALFSDLIEKMAEADDENISEDQFIDILIDCGFKDMTPYKNPAGDTRDDRAHRRLAQLEQEAAELREKLA